MSNAAIGVGIVALVLVIFLLYFIILGIAIGDYVLKSYGIYKLASRRQIEYPWLAWIPIASNWTLGALAEQYDARRGHTRPWKKVLLAAGIANVAGAAIGSVISSVMSVMTSIAGTASTMSIGNRAVTFSLMGGSVSIIMSVLIGIIEAVALYSQILCIFKVYESTVPEKALKYILLYLLVPLAGGICLIKCKDKGYPDSEHPLDPSVFTPQVPYPQGDMANYDKVEPVYEGESYTQACEDIPNEDLSE